MFYIYYNIFNILLVIFYKFLFLLFLKKIIYIKNMLFSFVFIIKLFIIII